MPAARLFLVRIIRWIARIWTILITVIVVLTIVTPDPYLVGTPQLKEVLPLGVLWGMVVAGLWLAWRWEGLGGAIATAGLPAYAVVAHLLSGGGPSPRILLLRALIYMLPGLLFLVCWFLSAKKAQPRDPHPQA